MLSHKYQVCMNIGYLFKERYGNVKVIKEWKGSEECSTITKLVYDMMNHLDIPCEVALGLVMEWATTKGVKNVEDHMWDDYCKGFLAGEILGKPTSINIAKAAKADKIWNEDDGERYGYYQEVLEEVK